MYSNTPTVRLPLDAARRIVSGAPHRISEYDMAALQQSIAESAALADVECNALAFTAADGRTWYDTRPMLDPREQPPEHIDMATAAIAYLLQRRIAEADPAQPHMLRVLRRP